MPDRDLTVRGEIFHTLKRLEWMNYILYGTLAVLIVSSFLLFVYPAHEALCGVKTNAVEQIDHSKEIVAEHPEILKQFGFTKAEAIAEQDRQQSIVDQLDKVPFCGS